MERITTTIPQAEVDRQLQYCREIARMNADRGEAPLAFVDTYGCQQNEADSERIRGYLRQMGYDFTTDEEQARIIVEIALKSISQITMDHKNSIAIRDI